MIIKRNRLLLFLPLLSFFLISCWDNFEERSIYSADAGSFSFKSHDTCPGIENYTFLIDQFHGIDADTTTGKIYNPDSLPYGRVVNRLLPVISFQSTNGKTYMNDSLWSSSDSVDFSKTVILKNTSYDGLSHKRYSVNINVHQVNPDSMQLVRQTVGLPEPVVKSKILEKNGALYNYAVKSDGSVVLFTTTDTCRTWVTHSLNMFPASASLESVSTYGASVYTVSGSKLYRSSDGISWSAVAPTCNGQPVQILKLYGELKRKYITDVNPAYLIGMVCTQAGDTLFARSTDGLDWKTGSAVQQAFPFDYYSVLKSTTVTGIENWTVANGVASDGSFTPTVWSTEDGLNWVLINDGLVKYNSLRPRREATLFRYSGKLLSFGGTDSAGEFHRDLMVSPDQGRTWREAEDEWEFVNISEGVSGAGAYVLHISDTVNEKDREFIWLTGGKTKIGAQSSVWKAFEFSMIFARR